MSSFVHLVQTESEIEVKGLIDALGLQEKQQYVRIFSLLNGMSKNIFSRFCKATFFRLAFTVDLFIIFLSRQGFSLLKCNLHFIVLLGSLRVLVIGLFTV